MITGRQKELSSDRGMAVAIGKNTAFGMMSGVVFVGSRLIMVPVVIHHIGLGGYGIWNIIVAIASYMSFGTGGIKSAFQKYVAEATGNGDYDTANKLLSTGTLLILALSLIILLPVATFSRKLAMASGVPSEYLAATSASISLLALTMAVTNAASVYVAILMGAHRIDLTKKIEMVTTAANACTIIFLLHLGYGILAMTAVVALTEVTGCACCFVASRQLLPEIRVGVRHFTTKTFRELARFAGSYQLSGVLELLYAMLVPIIILKHYGAESGGVYAVVSRLVSIAGRGQDALYLPLLSGGALVFAAGPAERISRFLRKSLKTAIAISLLPLAFIAAFGTLLIHAWTGQINPMFQMATWLLCLSAFFGAMFRVQCSLYRASGRALHDNVLLAFRITGLAILGWFGVMIGLPGFLIGIAGVEFVVMLYMLFALSSEMQFFSPASLIPDALKLTAAAGIMVACGVAAAMVPTPRAVGTHVEMFVKVGEVSLAWLVAFWPALLLTRAMSAEEQRMLLTLLVPRRWAPAPVND